MEVKVNVAPVNDSPIATEDEFTIDEDISSNIFEVLDNDKDVDGDELTIESEAHNAYESK